MSGSTLPTIMTPLGLQPQSPAALNAQLYAMALALSPGLTVLPGGLISDLGGTGTGALLVMDQARIDLINSVSPYAANPTLLYELGAVYGVTQGQNTNASVYLVFTGSAAGQRIPIGFTVSDGTNQYAVQDGGVIASSLQSAPLFAVATNSGTFAIPAGTVTQLVTSVPSGYTLSVTNPLAGTPAQAAQTIADYRAQVMQAGQVTSIGTAPFLKTLVEQVAGVIPALVAVQNVPGQGWKVIVGGSGDPYQVADAIMRGVGDIAFLIGSTINAVSFTAANPGVVTTDLNHGYATGQVVTIAGASPGGYNLTHAVTVISEKSFSVGVDTSGFGAYAGGGVVTPNFRNQAVTLFDPPDTYVIPFVVPPSQVVAMAVTWNTVSVNFVSATAIAQLVSAALANYVNALSIGQPMNVDVMTGVFQVAVAAVLPAQLISTIVFSVTINGVSTPPDAGTVLISGDPESSFATTPSAIVVEQI